MKHRISLLTGALLALLSLTPVLAQPGMGGGRGGGRSMTSHGVTARPGDSQRPGGFEQSENRFGQMGSPDGPGGRFRRGDGPQAGAVVADPDSPNYRQDGDRRNGLPGYIGPCDAGRSSRQGGDRRDGRSR